MGLASGPTAKQNSKGSIKYFNVIVPLILCICISSSSSVEGRETRDTR